MVERITAAEESIYTNVDDPMVNWDAADLQTVLAEAGFTNPEIAEETITAQLRVGPGQIERWFDQAPSGERLSFAQHLGQAGIAPADVEKLKGIFRSQLENEVVNWQSTVAYVATGK